MCLSLGFKGLRLGIFWVWGLGSESGVWANL